MLLEELELDELLLEELELLELLLEELELDELELELLELDELLELELELEELVLKLCLPLFETSVGLAAYNPQAIARIHLAPAGISMSPVEYANDGSAMGPISVPLLS